MSNVGLSVLVTPVAKPRMTQADVWKDRPVVKRYHKYCDELRKQLPNFRLPDELNVTFMLPMPASWSAKKKQAMLGAPHQSTPDIDNLAKGFMDAFKDAKGKTAQDKHVYSLVAEKYWAYVGSVELVIDREAL